MEAVKRTFAIWDFTGPSSGESVRAAYPIYPGQDVEHEYQRILAHVDAYTAQGALYEYRRRVSPDLNLGSWGKDDDSGGFRQ